MQNHDHVNPQLEEWLGRAVDNNFDACWSQEIRCCVPRLVDLMFETHDRPIEQVAPAVRSIIFESCQLDEGGDAAEHSSTGELDSAIFRLVREMQRLRTVEERHGAWSAAPVPPLMCG